MKIHCVSGCHAFAVKAAKIYHHRGFKVTVALSLLILVLIMRGEKLTLSIFITRCLDLAADLTAAKGLKVE